MAQTTIGKTPAPQRAETILPESYRHTIIESRDIPHTSMLSFVPGTPTLTEWYRGSYGADEEQHDFQPDSIETYQSYKRIHNLIVKLDDANGSFNFIPENGQSDHRLMGYVLYDLTPNKGDMFIKDIGDGRAGLYIIIEQPETRTIHADKCYYFESILTAIVTEDIMINLNKKVIEELYYSKDSHVGGGNAVLTKTDFNLNIRLYDMQAAIVDDILANHYFADEDTVVVPNEKNDLLYDPYLAKFLSYVLPHKLMGSRRKINVLNANYYVDNRRMQEPVTIWDMFYRNDFSNPKRYKQEFYTHPRTALLNTRVYGNVFFSKMDRVVVIHKESSARYPYLYSGSVVPIGPAVGPSVPQEGEPYPYYFGEDFINGGGTEVQQFVWKMFKDKTIDKAELMKILEGYWDLSDLDKLYMGGIYVGAIKTALITNSNFT